MEKIPFGIDAIPLSVVQEVPNNYGNWEKMLSQEVYRIREDIMYQQRQNAAMGLLHLAAISLAMVQRLGYEVSELAWLLDTEEEERINE